MIAKSAIDCCSIVVVFSGLYAVSAICNGTVTGSASWGTAGGSSRLNPSKHLWIWRLYVFGDR